MKYNFKWGLTLIAAAIILCTGCTPLVKNENIDAGMAFVEALDYDSALTSFEAAAQKGENARLLYRGEGLAYMGKTMYPEAAQSFEKSLSCSDGRIDGMDYDINYYLATAYYKQGENEKAILSYNSILSLKPKEENAYYLRGAIYAETGKTEEALSDFEQVITLNPKNYDRLIDIYCVLKDNGYKDSGQAYLKNAMDSGTKDMTNYEKGRICYYLGDYENARTYLEKAREGGGYKAVLFLGKTYEALGDYNYAISVYNTFLDGGEQNPQVLNQLGLCKMQMKDYAAALNAFQAAMKIENNGMMQALKMNEIVSYEYLEEYKKASVLLEGYLKTYPDDQEAAREYTFLQTR